MRSLRTAMKLLRWTWVLGAFCIVLTVFAAGATLRAIDLGAQVTAGAAAAAAKAAQHRRELAKADRDKRTAAARHRNELAKTKAKARLRRFVVAIPVAGTAAVAYFERRDYLDRKEEHPEGTIDVYADEVATASAEVVDDVLQELPEPLRPARETVSGALNASLQVLRRASE